MFCVSPVLLLIRSAWTSTFVLGAILHKHDNSRATSNKVMYKTTYSQLLKLKKEK